jgi:hypothetical protein
MTKAKLTTNLESFGPLSRVVRFTWVGLVACLIGMAARDVQAQMAPRAGTESAKPAAPLSTSLTLTVDGKTTKFSLADLKTMPQKTVKVHNEHNNMDETYSGVLVSDLLAKADFVVNKTNHDKIIRSYIKAMGTDKYWVVYAAIEVEPSEHAGDVIVASSMDGKGLGADGNLKLISTEDKKPQRWVRNLTAIALTTAE